jgi:hypothetical protein
MPIIYVNVANMAEGDYDDEAVPRFLKKYVYVCAYMCNVLFSGGVLSHCARLVLWVSRPSRLVVQQIQTLVQSLVHKYI